MTDQIPSSIRILRLVADGWLIREFSMATGAQGRRHFVMQQLGTLVHNKIAPMFPLQSDTTAPTAIQWLEPHDASNDYMLLTVEIFGPNPGGDRPCAIIEDGISEAILTAVAIPRDSRHWSELRVIAHIHS